MPEVGVGLEPSPPSSLDLGVCGQPWPGAEDPHCFVDTAPHGCG